MKSMLRWFVPSLVLVASLAACQVDLGEDLQFECKTDQECSDGFVCEESPSAGTKVCVSESAVIAQDAGEDTGGSDTSDVTDASDAPDSDITEDTGSDADDTGADADLCDEGKTFCGGSECVNTSVNVNHCGGCGDHCMPAPANSMTTCDAGSCVYSCQEGFSDSDGDWTGVEEPNEGANGCDIECVKSNGGVEICDNQDNDCDGEIDEGVQTTFYPDADMDNFGDEDSGYMACEPTSSLHTIQGGDCDDGEAAINPGAADVCLDNLDNDCDGTVDNGTLTADQVVAGDNHSCALVAGQPYCWGKNNKGQIGDGTTTDRDRPTAVDVSQVGEAFDSLVAGGNFTCGLTLGKKVWCWGSNRFSALGQVWDENDPATTQMSTSPVEVQNLPTSNFVELAAGYFHVCGVTLNKDVYCWGADGNEQLGRTVIPNHTEVPGKVEGGYSFASVTAGANHTCAIEDQTNTAYCWGRNFEGQVGNGSSDTWINTPANVDTTVGFQMIAAGSDHTCASDGTDVYCWGANSSGQVGDSTTIEKRSPTKVQGFTGTVPSVGAGGRHSCGRVTTGDIVCWGENLQGQLGDGTTTQSTTPVTVQSTYGFSGVSLGAKHTCGQTTNTDKILCWGTDIYGQLGNGSSSNARATTPDSVLCPSLSP